MGRFFGGVHPKEDWTLGPSWPAPPCLAAFLGLKRAKVPPSLPPEAIVRPGLAAYRERVLRALGLDESRLRQLVQAEG